jgi:iron(II)-dependent oxidoreductase
LSQSDAEATRRVGALLRFLAPFFSAGAEADSTNWEPHTRVDAAAYAAGVFASRWALRAGENGSPFAGNATAYTVVGQGSADYAGAAIPVPCAAAGSTYYDLYAGAPLAPAPAPGGGCALPLAIEARGYGAVLALGAADAAPNAALDAFLAKMALMTARPLRSFSNASTLLQQTMTLIAPAPLAAAPAGAVLVAGASAWPFSCEGSEIEGRTVPGNDVQFPWETLAGTVHTTHRVDVPNLYVDATPVTNAQYAAFLAASGYAPADDYNFLRDWAGAREPPAGWENKPVTWVDLLDARAYCAAGGKRLPHDWEWQYVAQGGVPDQSYPWGQAFDQSNLPLQVNGTVRPPPPDVGSFPGGDTAAGVKDLVGLVWQCV